MMGVSVHKPLKFAVLLIVMSTPASADEKSETLVMGIGMRSCAYWRESAAKIEDGNNWIRGFWTGLNFMNEGNHAVGSQTDPAGILAEVNKECEAKPSVQLGIATTKVFMEMARSSRTPLRP
jgi:hypothetical protein